MSGGTYDPRITAYFGDAMLRAGFMPLPHLFLRHYAALGLGPGEAMFVLELMEINWDLGDPPKTVNDLARRMGVNARTIRRYSEAVAELQLIELYDQYDASGAQIENGYDLSPLFDRLAAFAPEPPLAGQIRRRQRRASETQRAASDHAASPPAQLAEQPAPADKTDPRPPDRTDRCPPDKVVIPPADKSASPGHDTMIRGGRIKASGLKRSQRIPEEQKSMLHAASEHSGGAPGTNKPQVAGHSLRLDQPLTAEDIIRTDLILQQIGIDQPVRSRISGSLAPTEAWALWAYGVAKGWSVPLLISEVYDKRLKQARPAALPRRYDAVGRLLLALDQDAAERLLRGVVEQCPHGTREQVLECLELPNTPGLTAALDAVWHLVADVRQGPVQPGVRPPQPPRKTSAAPQFEQMWAVVLEELARQVAPAEFATWLQETALLELEQTQAFIGATNVFARERIESAYRDTIGQTLSAVLGRPVQVQVVLASAGA